MAARQKTITRQTLTEIRAFLADNNVVPTSLSKPQAYRWKKKYGNGQYSVEGETVYFTDKIDKLKKKVVPIEDQNTILQSYYTDPRTTGTSRDHFFNRVFHDFHGISRRQVQKF